MVRPIMRDQLFLAQKSEPATEVDKPCTRYKEIEVDYLDQNYKPQHGKYSGFTAQIIQHELDHVAGIVIQRQGWDVMKIFVDADACPVVGIVEKIAEKYEVPVTLLCDTNHVLTSDYSEVMIVGAGADAVDFKLISLCHQDDIVVTQDYGVAAMALGKKAYAIHQSGKWYTNENIDQMLMERHLAKKARRGNPKNHMKGPRKRTTEDNQRFEESFERLLCKAMSKEEY